MEYSFPENPGLTVYQKIVLKDIPKKCRQLDFQNFLLHFLIIYSGKLMNFSYFYDNI